MTVTETTAAAPLITLVSNFPPSGSTFTDSTSYTVPDAAAAVIVYGNNSFTTSDISAVTVSDVGGHTWDILTPTYDQVNMPFIVSYWKNTTGSSVNITPTITQTYANFQEVGYSVHIISGDDGSPSVGATVGTGASGITSGIEASGTPTVIGSRFCLHYIHQTASAIASSFDSGTTGDTSPASYGKAGAGNNALGMGTLYQSATNSQTSTPVTVGAAAPTDGYLFAVLVEYQPSGGGTGGTLTGALGTATAAGVPGTFTGSIAGGFTGVIGPAAAAGIAGTFSGGSAPQPVTESTIRAAAISYASNFAANSFGTYTVPAGATIVVVSGANDPTVTALVVSDADAHVWHRLVGYDPNTMPLAVDMWHNDTGTAQLIDVELAPAWTFNKTIGLAVYLINNCGASPIVKATITGTTTTPDASATPTVVGSLLCIHYIQQNPSAIVSAFETGTTGDTTAGGYGVGNITTNDMGLGTLYQTAPNTQTSSPVDVGATAPSATTYAALIEYLPADASIGEGFAGAIGHATASGVPGLFQGTVFVGVLAGAAVAGIPGAFEGTTVVTGPLATATAAGIPGTFAGTAFVGGGFTGVNAAATGLGVPGGFSSGDIWPGHVGAATAHGIPGTFLTTAAPLRNITITIGPITGGWTTDTPDGGWTAELPNGGWAGDAPDGGWADTGITA